MMDKYQDLNSYSVGECNSTYQDKISEGFFDKYMSGDIVLDIGYKGYEANSVPILKNAIGIDFDYPGYDGKKLPFQDGYADAIWASHVLEHIPDYSAALIEWFRVLKIGGYLIINVPHMFLYERKLFLPSTWNPDHKRLYTSARLLREIEETLPLDTFRFKYLCENQSPNYNYSNDLSKHAAGPYEISCVLQKRLNRSETIQKFFEVI